MRGPESSLCSDDLDFNPVWFCESKVIKKTKKKNKTQVCVININDGQRTALELKGNVLSILKIVYILHPCRKQSSDVSQICLVDAGFCSLTDPLQPFFVCIALLENRNVWMPWQQHALIGCLHKWHGKKCKSRELISNSVFFQPSAYHYAALLPLCLRVSGLQEAQTSIFYNCYIKQIICHMRG